MKRTWLVAAATVALAACGGEEPKAAAKPDFMIGDMGFTFALPKDFCAASADWKRSFEPVAQQNGDKKFLAQLVDCIENARYANSPNYILVMSFADPARQVLSRANQVADFKPNMDPKLFEDLMNSDKPFADLQKAVKGSKDLPLGEAGNQFPNVADDTCIYSGGRYGQPPLTPESSGTVINCMASVGDRQIIVMYNGDGKQDLLAMARKVRTLVRSIKPLPVAE